MNPTVPGDTGETAAVALAGGLIVTPTALTHLTARGQVLTVACIQGHRLPAPPPVLPAGLFAAHN